MSDFQGGSASKTNVPFSFIDYYHLESFLVSLSDILYNILLQHFVII